MRPLAISPLAKTIPAWVFLSINLCGSSPVEADSQSLNRRTEPEIQLSITSAIETVYSWRKDRCSDDFIPDAPARAFRKSDGNLIVIAAHYTNSILQGQ